jgi:signal transduction histidine kinase
MSASGRARRPSFIGQGLLILLPVLLLAGLGLVSLRQDQRLAEEDARQRAQEMLAQFSNGLGRRIGNPPSQADPILTPAALLSESGEALSPRARADNPAPPAWFANLPEAQMAAWDAARALEATNGARAEIEMAWRNFVALNPVAEAGANAEFALLRLDLRDKAPTEAASELCRFAQTNSTLQTESGVPMSAVVAALLLEKVKDTGLREPILWVLADVVHSAPSLLTEYLLAKAAQAAEKEPVAIREALRALAQDWEGKQKVRSLVQLLRTRTELRGPIATNLWLETPSGRYLALVAPGTNQQRTVVSGEANTTTNRITVISFYPKPVVEQAFTEALRETGLALPAYFALQAELEGEPLAVSTPPWRAGADRVLATASGELGQPDQPQGNTSGPVEIGQEGEPRPSHPRFRLAIGLADPAALYARQRQRTLWFGALILAVASTAVAGFVRARRAFLREHQLSELKTNFVSSVSHELRAPIASVRLLAESLERGKVSDPARQREYFHFIVQECRRLSSLVGNVLDFSRIEQGRKQYEFEPTDARALVRETLQTMEPWAEEREVHLRFQKQEAGKCEPDGQIQPVVDGRALQQALVNLLDNAMKHSPKKATVTVGLELTDNRLFLWVQDSGPGIPPSEHERIFERFHRLGSELRRETQGVGIGLSIVKHIVEAHGGRIRVESEVGEGSRFTIELPLTKEKTR